MTFQRARTEEQQQARRAAILGVARELLDERAPYDISLRELADRVGLAKSNVTRYFPTRESVFLEVLAGDWEEWLDAVEAGMPRRDDRRSRRTTHERIGLLLATTLAERPRLCALFAAHAAILEQNVTVEVARAFKGRALSYVERLASLVRSRLPYLPRRHAFEFSAATIALVAGAWPMTHPAEVVRGVLAEAEYAALDVPFEPSVGRALTMMLHGFDPE